MVNCFGRRGNRLTNQQKKILKLTPKEIISNDITNLNIREIPRNFIQADLVQLTNEFKDYRLVLNIPYNRIIDSYHDYAFVLLNNSSKAAEFCQKWDMKTVMDAFGGSRKIKFHKANHSPKKFLTQILESKSVFDRVRVIMNIY